jgi:ferredoxin-nitrate reductase
VGDGNIRKALDEGFLDLDSVCDKTGAGLGCGSCRPEIKKILEDVTQSALIT